MKLTVVGMGMGAESGMTGQAHQAIEQAGLILGAERMLNAVSFGRGKKVRAVKPAQIAQALAENPERPACVVCSGDTGFYSLADSLRRSLPDWEIETVAGISTVQYLAAKLGRSWQQVHLVSAHGVLCDPVGQVLCARETFFLTGGAGGAEDILRSLCEAGLGDAQVAVGQKLSYPDEQIVQATAAELLDRPFLPLAAVWVTRTDHARPEHFTPGLPDEQFCRGPVPMTKQLVRAAISSLLAPGGEDVLWDVGAGTGSVSVEMALSSPRCKVYAVEKNPEACCLIEQNRKQFGAYNLKICPGSAPQVLAELPAPDKVFIGGADGQLEEIMRLVLCKNAAAVLVASAITLESTAALNALGKKLREQGLLCEYQLVQLAVSEMEPLGRYHRFKPQNPIVLFRAKGAGR